MASEGSTAIASATSSSSWLPNYTAAISRAPEGTKAPPKVGCCPICCTFFSLFGALFLFVLAGLMNNDYHYIHISGDMPALSKSVTYGGLLYLLTAVISIAAWVRAAMRTGQFRTAASYTPTH